MALDPLATASHTALCFAWLLVMFAPLERAWPAWPNQPMLRPRWLTDLAFFLGQYLVFTAAIAAAVTALATTLNQHAALSPLAQLRAWFASLPFIGQLILVLALGDLCAYWGHRAQHRFELLWHFHAVHHSSEHLDWLAAHREHPLDGLYTTTIINAPALLLGFSVAQIMGLVAFRGIWAVFIHSNARLPLGPLHYLFGDPRLHHWHHARERHPGNYANLAPWVDLLFGTYQCPNHEPESLGLDEPIPTSYLAQLLHPLRPR
jgi:sterol desaturase/sphingolipid hydroxylase (fatty acid hydroxylase superfamily)